MADYGTRVTLLQKTAPPYNVPMRILRTLFRRARGRVYLDYAAATPVDSSVAALVDSLARSQTGNPGAAHAEGRSARAILDAARADVARSIHAAADEVVFTSGGTEANNLAILGHVRALRARGTPYESMHVLVSAIEHSSVRALAIELKRLGVSVTDIPVTEAGLVEPEAVRKLLTERTVLVSVMLANNEIGTVQPVRAIARAVRAYTAAHHSSRITVHTDASQAPLFLPVDVRSLGVDLLTLDGQKVYGPRGVGCIFRRRGVPLAPVLLGGGQETGLRPGTENVVLVGGFARALTLADTGRARLVRHTSALHKLFLERLAARVPQAVVNGSITERVPGNVNISIPGFDGEFLSVCLDEEGIAVTSKSACLGHGTEGSSVVYALGVGEARARGTLRFSFGRETRPRDIRRAVDSLAYLVAKFDKGV